MSTDAALTESGNQAILQSSNPDWSLDLDPRQRAFLEAFSLCGSVIQASKSVCHRTAHYRWHDEQPLYRENFRLAKKAFGDLLMHEAILRAVQGRDEPILRKGLPVKDEDGATVTQRRTDRFLLKHLLRIYSEESPSPAREEGPGKEGTVRALRQNATLQPL